MDSKSSRLRATRWKVPQPPSQFQMSSPILGVIKEHLVQVYTALSLCAVWTKLFPSLQPVIRFALRVQYSPPRDEPNKRRGVFPHRQRKLSKCQAWLNRCRSAAVGHSRRAPDVKRKKRWSYALHSGELMLASHLVVERVTTNRTNGGGGGKTMARRWRLTTSGATPEQRDPAASTLAAVDGEQP